MAKNPFNIGVDKNNYPAVGFSFHITTTPAAPYPSPFTIPTGMLGDVSEGSFQKVSGISATLQTEKYEALGMPNKQINLPKNVSYEDLTLTRGLVKKDSILGMWCNQMITGTKFLYNMERKIFNVFLYDHDASSILMTWTFFDCFPVKISVGEFDSMNGSSYAIDTLALSYSHFTKIVNPWQ